MYRIMVHVSHIRLKISTPFCQLLNSLRMLEIVRQNVRLAVPISSINIIRAKQ